MTRQQTRKTSALRSPETTAAEGGGGGARSRSALAADVDTSQEEALIRAKAALAYARAKEYAQKAKYLLAKAAAFKQKRLRVRAEMGLVRVQAASGAREAMTASTALRKRVAITSPEPVKKRKFDKTATAAPTISREMHRRLVWFKGVFERYVQMERLIPDDAASQDVGVAYIVFMEEEELKLQDDALAQEAAKAQEAAYAEDAALAVELATEACSLS